MTPLSKGRERSARRVLVGTALVLFGISGLSPPAVAQLIINYAFDREWGGSGSDPGFFHGQRGLALGNPGGNLFVADTENNRIQKFSTAGPFLLAFGSLGNGPGQFDHPGDVEGSDLNRVWVADTGNDRIQVFDVNGTFLGQWGVTGSAPGQFRSPSSVSVTSGGDILVADTGNDRIQRFGGSGAFQLAWGTRGVGPGQFSGPMSAEDLPDGRIYVADTGNNRIQYFGPNGVYLGEWTSAGPGLGALSHPSAVGAANVHYTEDFFVRLVVVADTGTDRIVLFTDTGAPFGVVRGSANSPGFQAPSGVYLTGPLGYLYISDATNARVQRWIPMVSTATARLSFGELKARYVVARGRGNP
jgi:tripartite motif-containing protein 71